MIRPFLRPPAALFLAALVVLSGCATDPENVLACPGVEVLRDLGEVTRFNPGPGRDPTDIQLEAWIDRVGGECTLDDDAVLVDLSVRIGTRRGPSGKTDTATIRYFVAITDSNRNVLSRQAFKTTAPYFGRKTLLFEDELDLEIPLAKGTRTDAFTIFVGLELTERELAYNRGKANR